MAKSKTTIKGLDRLIRKLGRLPGVVDRGAREAVADEVTDTGADMRRLAPHLTGNLAESVREEITNEGLGGEVYPTARYATFVNNGARGVPAQPFATAAAALTRKRFKARVVDVENEALRRLSAGGR